MSKLQPSKIFTILRGGHFEKGEKIMFLMQGFLGAFLVDIGTIKDSKLLESLCLQFCLGSPYIWAILTRLFPSATQPQHMALMSTSDTVGAW